MKFFKRIYQYLTQVAPAMTLALEELQEAEREILRAKSAMEYSESLVIYHTKRITRLRSLLTETISTV